MKVEFDKEADAAYIYLKDKIKKGEVKRQDLDKNKKLLGIEVLNATKNLAKIPQKIAA